MGRAPCCDKANVKKGPWSPEEDVMLKSYIEKNGTGGNWIALPQKIIGLKRCGKSCRLRWLNYLRPNIKHGGFSEEEDNIICSLYISIGSRWSAIAAQLPGRTDNDIKNYWNTKLKKKLYGKQRKVDGSSSKQSVIIRRKECYNKNNVPSPEFVIPYSTHQDQPRLINYDDHDHDHDHQASLIRKLLITIGGKFTNSNMNIDLHNFPASSSCSSSSSYVPIMIDPGINNIPILDGQISSIPLFPSDGWEFLYADMVNTTTTNNNNNSFPVETVTYGELMDDQWQGVGYNWVASQDGNRFSRFQLSENNS